MEANDTDHYFVACWRCEDILRGLVGNSTKDGDVWVDALVLAAKNPKPTSQAAYVKLVSDYIEAMNVQGDGDFSNLDGNRGTEQPLTPIDLWATPRSGKYKALAPSPTKPAPETHPVDDSDDEADKLLQRCFS